MSIFLLVGFVFVLFPLNIMSVTCVVKGSFHQGDVQVFGSESVGRQCVANAVMGVVYATQVPLHQWTSSVLDMVLQSGDQLYLQTPKKHHHLLMVNEIKSPIQHAGKSYYFEIHRDMFGNIDNRQVGEHGMRLYDAMKTIVDRQSDRWTYAVLCLSDGVAGSSVLLCIHKSQVYIFDSHSQNGKGQVVPNGTSVLLKFPKLLDCFLYI